MKIVITWASSWLWLSLAKIFCNAWHEVISIWRKEPRLHNSNTHLPTDFTEEKSIDQTIETITSQHSDISCIICCAGIGYIEELDQINYTHTQEMFQVNIVGHSYLLSWLTEIIKHNSVDLVFIWASIGYKANEHMPLYSVTKWWLRWLVENRRAFLKDTWSRVLHISPGWMNTESNIGINWRETIIEQKTWKKTINFLETTKIAEFIYTCVNLPKNMELAEVIINRK